MRPGGSGKLTNHALVARVRLRLLLVIAPLLISGCVMDDLNDIGRMFETPTPGQAARWALDTHDVNHRREGIVLLSTASFGGTQPYLDLYRMSIEDDPNPLVKSAAISALARHGTPEDAELIAPWCEQRVTDSVTIRWSAVQALQRLHNSEVVPVLIRVARDWSEQSEVRSAACVAMGQYPEDRVVQALIDVLDARELSINADAAQALSQLTGQEFGLDLTAWQLWYEHTLDGGTSPFASQQTYTYPTYDRDKVWWEHIAFWLDEQYEPSLQPIGLRPHDEKRTWDDFGDPSTKDMPGHTGDG